MYETMWSNYPTALVFEELEKDKKVHDKLLMLASVKTTVIALADIIKNTVENEINKSDGLIKRLSLAASENVNYEEIAGEYIKISKNIK